MAETTASAALPAEQLNVLRHALGIGHGGWEPSHRNHFATGHGSADHKLCLQLVERGLMSKHRGNALSGGDDVFCATGAGRKAAVALPPEQTAGQRRYAAFLREDSDISFGDWLRRESRARSLGLPRYG